MRTRIVRIGNSRGGSLLNRPITKPRAGWAEAFRDMARLRDDALIDDQPFAPSSWDEDEWEWS